MTKEQAAFIHILSDHLNGRKTEGIMDLDWDVLLDYGRRHQVSGMIYVQAKAFMPPEAMHCFRQETLAAYMRYSDRKEILARISRAMSEAQIPFFLIKGPLVAAHYPEPALREMSDIDLVVQAADRDACRGLLVSIGFLCAAEQKDREWQFFRNSLEIELHDRLVYQEAVNENGQDEYFNDCWKHVSDGQLEWNYHLMFLIFHLRKHLMNSGAGFRQFMDLAAVIPKIGPDWPWLEENLQKTGMLAFARKCFGFLYRWFGTETPITELPDELFYEEATQKIFADGIFGFDNAENRDSEVVNQVRDKRFPGLGMLRIAFHQVFPSRSELETLEPYTYLSRNGILLPVAWIHRVIRGHNKKKGKNIMSRIRQSFISGERIDRRNDMLRKWGLK